jgi:single-stranded-DNA-specific exonuclease
MKKKIKRRNHDDSIILGDLPLFLQRIYTARGIRSIEELDTKLEKLEPYHLLKNIDQAVTCLLHALVHKESILVIGDFDADGATSTALAVSCLEMMGANVNFLVPNRFEFGYGLTPEIVEVAAKLNPKLLLTVDNGISSHEGVLTAISKQMTVVITDHHLPGETLPQAQAIVNPNQPGDAFPSKNLAGVGVIFYVMMALRAKLRTLNWFESRGLTEPNMASFLDLVALGTIADVVALDNINRILVQQGLLRIKAGKTRPGLRALLEVAGRKMERIKAADLGFAVGPRLNAAGRLQDMRLGIECLLSSDDQEAKQYAHSLDSLNKERQQIEEGMREQAIAILDQLDLEDLPVGLCLFNETWHQGVIGILASRIKELTHRPVIIFALSNEGELKGSGRSIQGIHLKHTLEKIAAKYPGLILKFGGHALAAGLSLARENLDRFSEVFNEIVLDLLPPDVLEKTIQTDGELTPSVITIETAETLHKAGPWGQGFPEPVFDGQFRVMDYRVLKDKHIKFVLSSLNDYFLVDAIAFNVDPKQITIKHEDTLHIAYRLDVNEYRGNRNIQLLVDHFEVI